MKDLTPKTKPESKKSDSDAGGEKHVERKPYVLVDDPEETMFWRELNGF
jgi:hypothetical protein